MSRAIDIAGLTVTLGGADILSGVDLAIETGEWLTLTGPNGAGKTTLLRALLGAVSYGGTIDIEGVVDNKPTARAQTLAYVPQTPVVPPGILVIDYVLLGRTPHRGVFAADSEADLDVAAEVLDRLDLHGLAGREVRSLSGGERQRVVMARALAQVTPILLLDEPTTALDLGHQQEVLELVEELRHERNLTVLATLHDLTLAARYGDRIAVLAEGRVATAGLPHDVLTVELIAEHFGATVRIIDDPDGPVIVPTPGRRALNSELRSNLGARQQPAEQP